MTSEKILILDFGSQLTQLIARRLRENSVYCEIHPYTMTAKAIIEFDPGGIILSGGPSSTTFRDSPKAPEIVFRIGVPILGICYGMQTMVTQLGGCAVTSQAGREYGHAVIEVVRDCGLFTGIWSLREHSVWMSHGDRIEKTPPGFCVVATSNDLPAAIADDDCQFYGLMFHPEVMHTKNGGELLRNFTHNICGCRGTWTMQGYRQQAIERIREQVGDGSVICALSGGVDSMVTALLCHEAIGDRLTCVFVDNGLLRKNEPEQVAETFRNHFNIPLVHRKAAPLFLEDLKGVVDPEQKRKIIGKDFIDVFEVEAKMRCCEFLAQGTLYPDVIESVSATGGPSVTIKSHHNVGGLPEHMQMKLVEPLRDLFKDEVRTLGIQLGLPDQFVYRHPFPGPGLAIRIIGEVTEARLAILREADDIFIDEIIKAGLYTQIWQAFAVLLPINTVGVMGDARTYEAVCALRAVVSQDGMTAHCYPLPDDVLDRITSRIVNEVRGINRVVYDRTSKPPATIEWE